MESYDDGGDGRLDIARGACGVQTPHCASEDSPLPGCVVFVEARVKGAEVNQVTEQMIQYVLEIAGLQLGFKVYGEEARAGVDCLVAGYAVSPIC